MEIEQLVDEHIGSPFAEVYRGDFSHAWQVIQEHQALSPQASREEQAKFLRSRIELDAVCGRLRDAYTSLNELRLVIGGLGPEWGLRYAASKAFVDYYRRYPPCLRFQHETGMPSGSPLLGNIIGPGDIAMEHLQNIQRYARPGNEDDQGMCAIIQAIIFFPVYLRHLTTSRHRLYPAGSWKINDSKSPEEVIVDTATQLVNLREQAAALNAPIALYLARLLVELHYAMASPSANVALKQLYDAYESAGDKNGMANCKMMEGDNLLSAPFTSPVAQNIIPILPKNTEDDWDVIEARNPLQDSQEADKCYSDSLALFRESKSPRGQAAILLRQGCKLHWRACSLGPQHGDWATLVDKAGRKFQESLTLFGMDESNAQVVKANRILLDISRGVNPVDVEHRASEIGKWGRENQNELISRTLGILMFRFGRREWRQFSRFDSAIICFNCALQCSKELGDDLTATASVLAQAKIHDDTNNKTGARILIRTCLTMLDGAMRWFEERIDAALQTSSGQLDRQLILTLKYRFVWNFGHTIDSICLRADDLESFREWERKFRKIVHTDEAFAHMRSKMKAVFDMAMIDREIALEFRTADVKFFRSIEDGDLNTAEDTLYEFLKVAQEMKQEWGPAILQILAYQRLGDVRNARKVLDSLSDDDLFSGRLEEFSKGIGLDVFFPSLASTALYACVVAQDWKRGSRVLDFVLKCQPHFLQEPSTEGFVDLSFQLGVAAVIDLRNGRYAVAFQRLLEARRLVELRREQASDMDVKVGILRGGRVIEVFLFLAEVCITCSDAGIPESVLSAYNHGHPESSWEEHSLLFLEEARARSVVDSLQDSLRDNDKSENDTKAISEALYKYRAMANLQSLPKRSPKQEEDLKQLSARIENFQARLPRSTNMLMDTINSRINPQELSEHLKEDVIVIEATFSEYGCLLFGITNQGIKVLHKGTTRSVDIQRWVVELMGIIRKMTGKIDDSERQHNARVDTLSKQISDVLLTPFADIIRRKRHVIFSVSRPLTAFPFSMLPFDDKPLVLHAAVSQIPSLTVLCHLARRRSNHPKPSVSVFAKGWNSHYEEGSAGIQNTQEKFLHMAGIEAVTISKMFSTWPIEASNISRAEFRKYIEGNTSILHIGAHGNIDPENPLLSYIHIGEEFRVVDMSFIRSNANLLVFATCLSGLGQATTGNDVLGFTHVVLGTGCQAYIGTLFEVDDFTSMVLMIMFYRNLKTMPNLSLAEALRRAQVDFMNLDEARATAILDWLLEGWSVSWDGKSASDIVPDGQFLLSLEKMRLWQHNWSSPSLWAPFVLMGYGDFCFG